MHNQCPPRMSSFNSIPEDSICDIAMRTLSEAFPESIESDRSNKHQSFKKKNQKPKMLNRPVVRIFIQLSSVALIMLHGQNGIQQVEAGSKSSKASSKTTVIAIDGGGGGGKMHPIPVPWPVVHCHHHHHHLKYVPKPVLVHHWVKKYQPYDIEASEHKASLPMEQHEVQLKQLPFEEHNKEQGMEIQLPNIELPGKMIPMELAQGSRLVTSLNSVFGDDIKSVAAPTMIDNRANIQKPNSLPQIPRELIEQELRRHKKLANGKPVSLDKVIKSILSSHNGTYQQIGKTTKSNYKLSDADSDESFKSISLFNSSQEADGNKPGTFMETSSSNQFRSSQYQLTGKPNHPFDDPQDQMKDESTVGGNMLANLPRQNYGFDLDRANLEEQKRASALFGQLTADHSNKLQAINTFDRQLLTNQWPPIAPARPVMDSIPQPLKSVGPLPLLSTNPAINARAASALSESHTIGLMTKFAEHMAQMEAKKLIQKQQQKINSEKNANKTSANPQKTSATKNRRGLFSLFGSSAASIKNKRQDNRRQLQVPIYYDFADVGFRPRWPRAGLSYPSLIQAVEERRLFRHNPLMSSPPTLPNSALDSQASSIVNRIVDPNSVASLKDVAVKAELDQLVDSKRLEKVKDNTRKDPKRPSNTGNESGSKTATLDPEQEYRFYQGQREHLAKQKSMQARLNFPESKQITSAGKSSNMTTINGGPHRPQSSNVHESFLISNQQAQHESTQTMSPVSIQEPFPRQQLASYIPNPRPQMQEQSVQYVQGPRYISQSSSEFYPSQTFPMSQPDALSSATSPDQMQTQAPDMPSYLEFPLSPQQWSANAIRSMNQNVDGQQSGSNGNEQGYKQSSSDEQASSSDDVSGQDQSSGTGIGADQAAAVEQQKMHYQFEGAQFQGSSPFGQMLDTVSSNELGQMQSYSRPLYQMNHVEPFSVGGFSANQLSSGSPYMAASNQLPLGSYYQSASMPVIAASSSFPKTGGQFVQFPNNQLPVAPYLNGPMAMDSGPLFSGKKAQTAGLSSLSGLNGPDQVDTLETATNDMNQLRQFGSSLGTMAGQANNATAMARLSLQLRNQMQALQQRLPSMPNIPQPPQIPNLPMPPPGMMQMAGLALPFAMARATRNNRIRNQQVNAAANGGGTSTTTGQRLLSSAASLTNRLMRPRRRPTSTPSGVNRYPAPPNRRRIMGVVQTVLDMRRRPNLKPPTSSGQRLTSAVAAAANANKLKPKVDQAVTLESLDRARRLARSLGAWSTASSRSSSAKTEALGLNRQTLGSPNAILATQTDGQVSQFSSMTSPVDALHRHLDEQQRKRRKIRQPGPMRPYFSAQENHIDTESGNGQQIEDQSIHVAQMDLLRDQQQHPVAAYEYVKDPALEPKYLYGQQHLERQQAAMRAVMTPLVANHINLLLFAQNVTGAYDHLKPPGEQQQQQQLVIASQVENQSPTTVESQQQQQPVVQQEQEQAEPAAVQQQEPSTDGNPKQEDPNQQNLSSSDERKPEQSRYEPVAIKFADTLKLRPITTLPTISPTKVHLLTTRRVEIAPVSTSTTTTTTTTTTRMPEARRQSSSMNLYLSDSSSHKLSKYKRSTTRPSKQEASSVRQQTQNIETTSLPIVAQTTGAPSMPVSEHPVADYVRAIKLIRGVAYPWPPPTKSSKLLEGLLLPATTLVPAM